MTGNVSAAMSNSLIEPSPHATRSWFSLISDQARSYNASLVSKLHIGSCQSLAWEQSLRSALHIRLLNLDPSGRQTQGKQPAIPHDAKVGRRGYGYAIIIVGRVLDGIWVEALCAEFEHSSHDWAWRRSRRLATFECAGPAVR